MQQVFAIPEPGDVIGGKYRIERPLGSGGMGAVFEVSHLITNKRFALKWLLADVNSGVAITRFIREAKVAGRFQHRNIVEVYDVDKEGNSFYMVMELLQGESLAERLTHEGRLVAREACRILMPCMHAISAAHAAGIIHRDIKPANIFLCQPRHGEPETPKVLDFGVASFTSAQGENDMTHTRSGALVGTPFYMAPEQMRGAPIDQRVDVYALGVTLYEILSCERPFKADSYGDLVLKVASATPTPLEELVNDLPRGLSAIVNRAMAREPEQRFATTEDLIAALEPFRDNSIAARVGFDTVIQPPHRLAETPLSSETFGGRSDDDAPRPAWRRRAPLVLGALGLLLLTTWIIVRARNPEQVNAPEPPGGNQSAQPSHAAEPPPPFVPSEPASPPGAAPIPAQEAPPKAAEAHPARRPVSNDNVSSDRPARRVRERRQRSEDGSEDRLISKPPRGENNKASVSMDKTEF